ncbi:ORF6N domain-containing protein [Candidatus Woesearchaeota archaeon]|nr:ORF6N domain-containing protein [Candidatus Woesearchaeota archaeon]
MQELKNKIYAIRGAQVMLDNDLAELYDIEVKALNQAAKRNIDRFPKKFMFQLTEKEYQILKSNFESKNENPQIKAIDSVIDHSLKSQIVTSNRGGNRKLPHAFTEQGVAMLSAVLRSKTAIEISIKIIEAFVEMRKFISNNAQIFQRLDSVELKQLEYQTKTNKKFEKIFTAIEDKSIQKKQGIFFEGQVFDAYSFVSDLIRTAKNSIILIDNYIDDSILILFTKTKVKTTIYTNITKQLELDLKKYKDQYNNIEIKQFNKSHDRFLIIDNQVYHFGASLKDLGKKWFAFSKLEKDSIKILDKLSLTGD